MLRSHSDRVLRERRLVTAEKIVLIQLHAMKRLLTALSLTA